MPGADSQAGLADEVLPLDRVAETILRHLAAGPGAAASGVRSRTGAVR
jgi:two-component system chemotaxis response regulator CheB